MDIKTVTVVGTGNMGSGIAQSFAAAGFTVRMHDVAPDAIARGLERIRKPLEKRVAEGKMPAAELAALMDCLQAEPDFHKAAQSDLVVEAVFEDLAVKTDLFARLDKAAPVHTILATNTSSLYVKDLASATKRPQNVVGLHYFFPAAINKLVEVVRGPATGQEAFVAAHTAVRKAGKTPIETADAPGFCVNRFFVPWINEACRILEEGVASIPTIEAAAKQSFGISMGPFELMNVTGVPISLHAQSTLHRELGAFYEPAKALRAQVEKKQNWDLAGTADIERFAAVQSRLRGVVYGIAAQLVHDKVASIRDTDRGATIGLRWAKGPFAMMNEQGIRASAADVEALAKRWGKAFAVPPNLAAAAVSETIWAQPTVILQYHDEGRIARILFDRPEALNALGPAVLADLALCVKELEERSRGPVEERPRVVIVTGEGKAFVAGADIQAMRAMGTQAAREYTQQGHAVLDRLAALPCPVVMAVNGFAFGGGLELALAGDLLVASDKAQLGLPEVGLGIHPGFGGTQRLARRIGVGKAKDLVYTGRTVGAAEAQAMGLVDRVVPLAKLEEETLALARAIAQKAPLAVAGAKASIDQGMSTDLASGLRIERDSVVLLFATADKQEGLNAFVEKRAPRFTGK